MMKNNTNKTDTANATVDDKDKQLLKQCESTIKRGLKEYNAVGEALATIQKKKLYRFKGYKTFDAYCRKEWNISRVHAWRLVDLQETNKTLPLGNKIQKESSNRKFKALPPPKREEVKARIVRRDGPADKIIAEEADRHEQEKKKQPSDHLLAMNHANKLWEIVVHSPDKDAMLDLLQPLIKWATEYQERKRRAKLNDGFDELPKAA